jgi:uncharacterized Zn finger protein
VVLKEEHEEVEEGGSMEGDFERRFGIRMQSTRSRPPRKRWSRQWQEYMESLHMGARIGRGRQYATGGNVRSLVVSPGLVMAEVRGSAPAPYRCEISCDAADAGACGRLADFLRSRPMLLARLLTGDLPEAVETRFRVEGVPLSPSDIARLSVHCSCPDGAAFCKHSAAVMFLLCETFDADPLLLLKFRGLDAAAIYGEEADTQALRQPDNPTPRQPGNPETAAPGDVAASGDLMEFPGPLPIWRGESRFAESVQECLDRASLAARRRLDAQSAAS